MAFVRKRHAAKSVLTFVPISFNLFESDVNVVVIPYVIYKFTYS